MQNFSTNPRSIFFHGIIYSAPNSNLKDNNYERVVIQYVEWNYSQYFSPSTMLASNSFGFQALRSNIKEHDQQKDGKKQSEGLKVRICTALLFRSIQQIVSTAYAHSLPITIKVIKLALDNQGFDFDQALNSNDKKYGQQKYGKKEGGIKNKGFVPLKPESNRVRFQDGNYIPVKSCHESFTNTIRIQTFLLKRGKCQLSWEKCGITCTHAHVAWSACQKS